MLLGYSCCLSTSIINGCNGVDVAEGVGVFVDVERGKGIEVFVGAFVGASVGGGVLVAVGGGELVTVDRGGTVGAVVFVGGITRGVCVDVASNAAISNILESIAAADCSVGNESKPSTTSCSYSQLFNKNIASSAGRRQSFFENAHTECRFMMSQTSLSVHSCTRAEIQHCKTTNLCK